MYSHLIGTVAALILISVVFAACAGAFFWGLVIGRIPTEELVEGKLVAK